MLLAGLLYYFASFGEKSDVAHSVLAEVNKKTVTKEDVPPPRNMVTQQVTVTGSPTLEIDVPATMSIEMDVYIVKKGDTLWYISERLTGNPYNYPRIAGRNEIANPDLIFPGQRINLIRK